ncbi:MAG: hypothetical protein K0R65_3063 [Crocinitomicaceae bacterium]|jgi:hypothetical protein|nr:hypothetical protein [Crocinitomicaceae bacterium]
MKFILAAFFACTVFFFGSITSCTKDQVSEIDAELFEKAQDTANFTWYKHNDTLLPRSSGSGHAQDFLRTRYNSIAASQLDPAGKVKANAKFPEGSLIVKELYTSPTGLGRYAVLFKNSGDGNADPAGWIWGYIDADGTVSVPASKKGASCIECHSQSGSVDYMLMNKYFP